MSTAWRGARVWRLQKSIRQLWNHGGRKFVLYTRAPGTYECKQFVWLETVRGPGFAVNTPCGVTLDRDGCTAPRSSWRSTFPSRYGGFGSQTCVPPPAEERHAMCCDMDSTHATVQQALQYQDRHHILGGETAGPVWPGPWLHRRARSKLRDLKCSRICGSCSD